MIKLLSRQRGDYGMGKLPAAELLKGIERGPVPGSSLIRVNELNFESTASRLGSDFTANEDFFVRSHFPTPIIDASKWTLVIDGSVERRLTISYDELLSMQRVTLPAVIECAGNHRSGFKAVADGEVSWGPYAVGNAEWTGVPLCTLLQQAGVRGRVEEVIFYGSDSRKERNSVVEKNFARSLPWPYVHGNTNLLIAIGMNGTRLPLEHGYPARVVALDTDRHPMYGMASVKWLKRITVSNKRFNQQNFGELAFFNDPKYNYVTKWGTITSIEPVDGVRLNSRITYPAEGQELNAGEPVTVIAKAWGGAKSVSINLGSKWVNAELVTDYGNSSWSTWRAKLVPETPGIAAISSVAKDGMGKSQPSFPIDNLYQYGNNAVHALTVKVLKRD